MCLTNILTKDKETKILDQYPDNELIKGWKVVNVYILQIKSIYGGFLFQKGLNHANTDIEIIIDSRPDPYFNAYKSGFHIFTNYNDAVKYHSFTNLTIIPVYFRKKDITNVGEQLNDPTGVKPELLTLVIKKLEILTKDYDEAIKG